MNVRGIVTVSAVSAVVAGWCSYAGAGTFEVLRHEASGMGTAHVFDGGPVVTDSLSGAGTNISLVVFDNTQPGVNGATYSTSGRSWLIQTAPSLRFRASFSTAYSAFGADRPGGEGAGDWFSVFEFVMPAESLELVYTFDIDQDPSFSGLALTIVENITHNDNLLTLDTDVFGLDTLEVIGNVGDVIRIASTFQGEGTFPADLTGFNRYFAAFEGEFFIPEPTAALMVGAGAIALLKTRRTRVRR